MSKKSNNRLALEMLFELPLEPITTPRNNGSAIFKLPEDDIYRGYYDNGKTVVVVQPLEQKPDLSFTKPLENQVHFSLFIREHQIIAARLIELFMKAPNQDQFIALCVYCKDRVNNAFLFQYCYAVAMQHRHDTKDIPIKIFLELFPQNFIDPAIIKDIKSKVRLLSSSQTQPFVIPINFTASDKEPDQRVAYFREDPFVNSHHWHWHVVYPGFATEDTKHIVDKDRRGELFYYMHHQMMARYNTERFCNDLPKAVSYDNFLDPIKEGYFPKILDSSNNRTYPGRDVNLELSDLNRAANKLKLEDMELWYNNISTAIVNGFLVDHEQKKIPLDPKKGIDFLGNIVESTMLSVNFLFYGNLHNMGHNVISCVHDPDGRFLEESAVMGDFSTAMRDPVFFRLHSYVDDIFMKHKDLLDPYSRNDLEYKDIVIAKLEVEVEGRKLEKEVPNTLITHLATTNVDLVTGIDFKRDEKPENHVYVTFTHLQHLPFRYLIHVTNKTDKPKSGTCRIFLCPKALNDIPLDLNDQRKLAIEMDKFAITLNPGEHIVKRESSDSSVTLPYRSKLGYNDNSYCGCGWPDHLLLPKGKPEGMSFDLFAMISDDEVKLEAANEFGKCAKDAPSFCGLKDKKYPDTRSMGYPFDRRLQGDYLKKDPKKIKDLVQAFPNMSVTDVVIRFKDAIVDAKELTL